MILPLVHKSRRPLAVLYRPRRRTRYLILHDSHTQPDIASAEAHLRWQGRQMGLLDIGYHYIVERDGAVVETRPMYAMGSHTPGFNHESVGVCLIGGRNLGGVVEDNFTGAQRESLAWLLAAIKDTHGPVSLVGHTELQRFRKHPHPCPPIDMDALRKDLAT